MRPLGALVVAGVLSFASYVHQRWFALQDGVDRGVAAWRLDRDGPDTDEWKPYEGSVAGAGEDARSSAPGPVSATGFGEDVVRGATCWSEESKGVGFGVAAFPAACEVELGRLIAGE